MEHVAISTSSRSVRVLLVEDEAADRRLIREFLRAAPPPGYEVEEAQSLGAALERLEQEPFEVVLLDLGLPDARDLEAPLRVLDEAPDAAVLVLTGRDDEDLGVRAVKEGAQDYLVKGTTTDAQLRRAIQHAIQRQATLRDLSEAFWHDRAGEAPPRLPDGIVVVDARGRVLHMNRAAESIHGRSEAEMRGRPYPILPGSAGLRTVNAPGGAGRLEIRAAALTWEDAPATLLWLRALPA